MIQEDFKVASVDEVYKTLQTITDIGLVVNHNLSNQFDKQVNSFLENKSSYDPLISRLKEQNKEVDLENLPFALIKPLMVTDIMGRFHFVGGMLKVKDTLTLFNFEESKLRGFYDVNAVSRKGDELLAVDQEMFMGDITLDGYKGSFDILSTIGAHVSKISSSIETYRNYPFIDLGMCAPLCDLAAYVTLLQSTQGETLDYDLDNIHKRNVF